jgi:hypothetical protein
MGSNSSRKEVDVNLTTDDEVTVSVEDASKDLFSHILVGTRYNQLEGNFDQPFNSDVITNSTTGTGSASQANGQATYSTGTGVTASAKGKSVRSISYRAGNETYFMATATFTPPTDANSHQRAGLISNAEDDGIWFGYEGTTFTLTILKNTVATNVTSWSEDPLDGSASSTFTRNGTPEAIDYTALNVFRIRYGWLGAAGIKFDVLSPDGKWVNFHYQKYANSLSSPFIEDTTVFAFIEVDKASSDATDLIMDTGCMAAGSTSDLVRLNDTLSQYDLAKLTRSVITGETTAGGGTFVNVKVDPAGALETTANQDTHDSLNANANIQVGDADVSTSNPVPITNDSSGGLSVDLNDSARTLAHTATTIGTSPATIALTNAVGFRFYLADTATGGEEVYIRGTTTGTPSASNAFVVRKFQPYELWMQPGETITVTYEYVGSVASIPIIYEVFT